MNGRESSELWRGYFALQLRFAEVLAARAELPLPDAITYHTNLHRRFAYGNIARQPPAPQFLALAERLASLPEHSARVDALVCAFAERPVLSAPAGSAEFGCFRYEPPDAEGRVRLHFSNRDSSDGTSPLHISKVARRRAELKQLVEHLAQHFPQARAIVGTSWLYNTAAYRRLFPSDYVASRAPLPEPSLHGGSIWGQFLDFRGAVKPAVCATFLKRLASSEFDPKRPWTVFGLAPLRTTAPLETFCREYALPTALQP